MSRRSNWHYLSPSTVRTDAPTGATHVSEREPALRRASPRRYSFALTPRFTVNTAARGRPEPLRVGTPTRADGQGILSREALEFLGALVAQFGGRVTELLRRARRANCAFKPAKHRTFLPQTRALRESDWRIAAIPSDLLDRRVEITGPTDRKMTINALNSGARVFMADCEDSLSPTWENIIGGQQNLYDAVRRKIEFVSPEGKVYRLNRNTAVLIVRPRGWHLYERHLTHGGAGAGRARGFRPVLLPQRARASGARHRCVLLSAEDGKSPRGATLGGSFSPSRKNILACRAARFAAPC